MKKLQEIMSRNVTWTTPDASIEDVSRLMVKNNCGEIPVIKSDDEKTVLGVITDRDIVCRSIGKGRDPMNLKARDLMTPQVIMAHDNSSLSDVIGMMRDHHIRRVPVVNEKNELSGIVSEADIFRASNEKELQDFVHEYIKSSAHEPPASSASSQTLFQ